MKLPHSWGGRFILLSCLKLALTALIVSGWLLTDGTRWRTRLEAEASALLRQPVTIAEVEPVFAWGHGLALNAVNVRVAKFPVLPQAQLAIDPLALLRGRLAIRRAALMGNNLHAVARFGDRPSLDLQAPGLSLQLQGKLQQDSGQTRLEDVSGTLNNNDFTGTLALSQHARLRVEAALSFPRYAWAPKANEPQPIASVAATPQPLFSYAGLPWTWLQIVDAALTLQIGQLSYNDHALGPAYLQADLADGQLAATALAQPPAAAQPLKLQLIAAAQQQQVQLAFDAHQLDPLWWASLGGSQPLVTSPATLAVRLDGQGASLHELAQSARGRIVFAAQPGRLNTAALPGLVVMGLDGVLGRERVEAAALACLKADFAITNGIANATRSATDDSIGIGLASDLLTVAGAGQVDLGRETADLRFVAAPRLLQAVKGFISAPVPVAITGPLTGLTITPDLATAGRQLAGQLLQGAGGILPGAAAALLVAKSLGHDPAPPLASPPNPCLAPQPQPIVATDTLPPLLRAQLQHALDALAPYLQQVRP